jgi:osmotically-inducible protein OsmY
MKTDIQLQQDVSAELKWEPSIQATRIGVEVEDGVVTLAGHVASYGEKWDAERAAQRVAGVKALAVEIEVRLPALGQRADVDIARAAQNTLEWMLSASRDGIQVLVEGGWVTLSGKVDWQYQQQAAADGVRHLMGVTGVSNQILIAPRVNPGVVKADIEAALTRRAKADAQQISVQVSGSDVTLTGRVDSWAERQSATA